MNTRKFDLFVPLGEADTPTQMRDAIEAARLHNPVVQRVMDFGRYSGMSAIDIYTVLAYHALQSMINAQRHAIELSSLMPMPTIVVNEEQARNAGVMPVPSPKK